MGNLHVGTSGWSYKHWKGHFYPGAVSFEYYAEHFDCVELNTSFYRMPKKETVQHWNKIAPKGFMFCPKLSRYITHIKRLHDCEEPLRQFLDLFRSMKKRLGPILVQLPPSLKFSNDNVQQFLFLLKRYRSFQFALEPRHESWLSKTAARELEKHGVIWVIAESGGRYPYQELVTTQTVYFRFHGKEELYSSNYSRDDLLTYAAKTKQWLKEGKDIWAFFDNDAEGYAVKNALLFRELANG